MQCGDLNSRPVSHHIASEWLSLIYHVIGISLQTYEVFKLNNHFEHFVFVKLNNHFVFSLLRNLINFVIRFLVHKGHILLLIALMQICDLHILLHQSLACLSLISFLVISCTIILTITLLTIFSSLVLMILSHFALSKCLCNGIFSFSFLCHVQCCFSVPLANSLSIL